MQAGFRAILVFLPGTLSPPEDEEKRIGCDHDTHAPDAVPMP